MNSLSIPHLTKEHLSDLYLTQNKSLREIATLYQSNAKTISRYLKRFSIKARPFSTKGLQTRLGAVLSEETKRKIGKAHWRGGSYLDKNGYRLIMVDGKYEFEHRVVAAKFLGRPLKSEEIIHHVNHDRLDNRVENLSIVTRSEHMLIHWSERK